MLADKILSNWNDSQLLAKFIGSFPAVQYVQLHYRDLERDKIMSLKIAKGNFSTKIKDVYILFEEKCYIVMSWELW